jgi:hypothetical protein
VTTPLGSEHLDLDALADAAAGEPGPGTTDHLAGCAQCEAEVDRVRASQAPVTAALSALPDEDLPTDVAAAIAAALAAESRATGTASVTTLPPRAERTARRWLPAAAAVVLVLAGAGYGITQLGSSGSTDSSTASDAGAARNRAETLGVVRNDTGNDYTGRATLAAAVPQLLAGTAAQDKAAAGSAAAPPAAATVPQRSAQTLAAADPLARLRDNTALADCLLALLPPEDPDARPLALDYALFNGQPALVVVLPSALPNKLDVFVVGPGCSQANDSTLFYTSVDRS